MIQSKKQLVEALAPFADDQYVGILLFSEEYPNGSQVFLQEIRPYTGWYCDEHDPKLLGLVAHAGNVDIRKSKEDRP